MAPLKLTTSVRSRLFRWFLPRTSPLFFPAIILRFPTAGRYSIWDSAKIPYPQQSPSNDGKFHYRHQPMQRQEGFGHGTHGVYAEPRIQAGNGTRAHGRGCMDVWLSASGCPHPIGRIEIHHAASSIAWLRAPRKRARLPFGSTGPWRPAPRPFTTALRPEWLTSQSNEAFSCQVSPSPLRRGTSEGLPDATSRHRRH